MLHVQTYSFPTRRPSYLYVAARNAAPGLSPENRHGTHHGRRRYRHADSTVGAGGDAGQPGRDIDLSASDWRYRAWARSEEHTSETPVTNAYLVCRLSLEKTKQST